MNHGSPWFRATTTVTCLAVALLSGACSRVMSVSPETAAERNQATWEIRHRPASPSVDESKSLVGGDRATPGPTSDATTVAAAEAHGEAPPPARNPTIRAPLTTSTSPTPAGTAGVSTILPFRMRPEITLAFRSSADAHGIPTELYRVDPLLLAHRHEMESQASARRSIALGLIFAGAFEVAIAALSISLDLRDLNARDQKRQDSATMLTVDGLLAAFGLGEVISGFAMTGTSSNADPLQKYYRETYVTP